jgi:error-prone DNA polymerase
MISAMNFLAIRFRKGETMDSFLRRRTAEGVMKRYGAKHNRELLEKAKKQVEHELALIEKAWFCRLFSDRVGPG